ncbi:Yip1 family protein [Sphingobacterium sp. CZ-UAM]|uniref:Yip1 family protein n=1 Tax=Sphingobacterium sp. CZ-UAM TaxID=1933868 RepID=UPI00111594AC|nr:Yip1 family protein [Sphingobacterium sp. CZ-UAM]
MRSGKLNSKRRLFSYLLKIAPCRWGRIFFYPLYIFFCSIFSLVINLGSAGSKMPDRILSKRFIAIWIGTVLLLLVYAMLISYMHTALMVRQRFGRNAKLNFMIYALCSFCVVLAIHGVVLEILLPDRPGLILLSRWYLTTDFWFFFPMVVAYTLFVHRFPKWVLLDWLPFGQMTIYKPVEKARLGQHPAPLLLTLGTGTGENQDPGAKTTDQLEKIPRQLSWNNDQSTAMDLSSLTKAESQATLLSLWQRDRDRLALMVYLLRKWEDEELIAGTTIKCLNAVIIYKEQRTADVYMHNGKFCRIEVTTKVLRENPWLVKVRAKVYVNMLFFRVPVNRPTMLELTAEIKEKLQRLLPEDKLKILVTPSRELRNNINNFWGIIDTLDETKLEEEFNLA